MVKKALQNAINTSLIEKAKNDKKCGAGVGRGNKLESTRAAFKAWLLLPRTFLGQSEAVIRELGIANTETMELCSIRSQSEFAAKFNVQEVTLSRWKKEFHDGNDFNEFKASMRQLTKNIMGALYKKALVDGDAARVKLWLQSVEGWTERTHYDVALDCKLSIEEKAALDRLIERNTVLA